MSMKVKCQSMYNVRQIIKTNKMLFTALNIKDHIKIFLSYDLKF